MKSRTSVFSDSLLREPQDFSLVLGGPLFQLLRRSRLMDDALELLRRRIIIISLFAWLPLFLLSALERQVLGGECHRTLPAGRGSSRQVPAGDAPADRCRACGAPAHALRGEAIPGAPFDSGERQGAFRCRRRVGIPAAQLSVRRGAADRLRVRRRHPDCLAPVHVTRHGHMVRDTGR